MNEDHSSSSNHKSFLDKISQFFSAEPEDREDVQDLIKVALDKSIIEPDAAGIIQGALHVSDMQVREIMVPRSQMVAVKAQQPVIEYLPTLIESAHSRFPVLGDSPDDVIGILLAKDLLAIAADNRLDKADIKELIRPATFVPESKRLYSLLKEFRVNRNHMAIVVDEYGGVAGIVTIEDVLEQIVGEIEDEHDFEDDHLIKPFNTDEFIVKALTPVEDFNEHFNSNFSDEEFDTIGGLVVQHFGHLPKREESISIGSFKFEVLNADNRTIRLLKVKPEEPAAV